VGYVERWMLVRTKKKATEGGGPKEDGPSDPDGLLFFFLSFFLILACPILDEFTRTQRKREERLWKI
jgi:hypothetical protein